EKGAAMAEVWSAPPASRADKKKSHRSGLSARRHPFSHQTIRRPVMTRTLFTTAALALAIAATPASAQLLGGSGGLGGTLGGSLGGTLGSAGAGANGTLSRSGAGELRTERQVDTRSGRVRAGGSASGEGGTLIDSRSPIGGGGAETR